MYLSDSTVNSNLGIELGKSVIDFRDGCHLICNFLFRGTSYYLSLLDTSCGYRTPEFVK